MSDFNAVTLGLGVICLAIAHILHVLSVRELRGQVSTLRDAVAKVENRDYKELDDVWEMIDRIAPPVVVDLDPQVWIPEESIRDTLGRVVARRKPRVE